MELWANILRPKKETASLIIHGETSTELMAEHTWPFWRICEGQFAVQDDSTTVQALASELYETKLQALRIEATASA